MWKAAVVVGLGGLVACGGAPKPGPTQMHRRATVQVPAYRGSIIPMPRPDLQPRVDLGELVPALELPASGSAAVTLHRRARRLAADKSDRSRADAISSYRRLATDPTHRSYAHLDAVRFELGILLQRGNEMPAARKAFYELIKNHPTSPFVPAVYLTFGDYFFNTKADANAEQFYSRVLRFPKSPMHAYAMLMKLRLQVRRGGSPADILGPLVGLLKDVANSNARGLRRAVVTAYVRAGLDAKREPAKLRRTLQQLSPEYLKTLAQIQLAGGPEYADAEGGIATAQELVRHLHGVEACEWAAQAAHAGIVVGDRDTARGLLTRVVAARRKVEVAANSPCAVNTRYVLGTAARRLHERALQEKDSVRADQAASMYDDYLAVAVHAQDRHITAWLRAELSWFRSTLAVEPALWRSTARQFELVANMPGAPAELVAKAKAAASQAKDNAAYLRR